jgi:hypothetical protein
MNPGAPVGGRASGDATSRNGDDSSYFLVAVVAEKQGVRVYLYHGLPYDASQFSGTGLTERDHYWDTVVARDFAVSSKQERNHNIIGMKPKYLEGGATDRATGAYRFLMLYVC